MEYKIIDLPEVELLSEEETRTCIVLAQKGDNASLEKIVKHNLRLVLKITYRFKNRGYELQDLFQIGVIGLIKAVKGFSLEKGYKFSTYAVSKIIGEIRLFLRDDGIIKVSRSLKKVAGVVKKKEEELSNELSRSPSISELAAATEYSRDEIINALEANKSPTSIYQSINKSEEGNDLYLIDRIKEEKDDDFNKVELVEVIKKLEPRSRKIIFMRYFEDKTQQEIAEEIGVSQVQVSRLEKKILKELKSKINYK